jgi:hypothetical protein
MYLSRYHMLLNLVPKDLPILTGHDGHLSLAE